MVGASLGHSILLHPHGAASVFGCCGNKITTKLKKRCPQLIFSHLYQEGWAVLICIEQLWGWCKVFFFFWPPVILWTNSIFLQCTIVIWIFCLPVAKMCRLMLSLIKISICIRTVSRKGKTSLFFGLAHANNSLCYIICRPIFNGHIILPGGEGFLVRSKLFCPENYGGKIWPSFTRQKPHFSCLGCSRRSFVLSR